MDTKKQMSLQTWLYILFFAFGGIMGTGHDGNYELLTVNVTVTSFLMLSFGGVFVLITHDPGKTPEKTSDFKLLIKVIILLIFGAFLGHLMCPL